MDQNKMISEFHLTCIKLYNQVSDLQYYQGQGPYIMALDETGGACEFHCYEFVDAETFISSPEEIAPAFQDPDFFFNAAATLNLDGIKDSDQYFSLALRKVVPDMPECRLAAKKIKAAGSGLLKQVVFWNETEEMCSTVLPNSIIFN